MKKIMSLFLSIALILNMSINAFALTDTYIFTDTVSNTYVGQTEASDMMKNLSFTDLAGSPYREAIIRMGAFNIVKGYGNTFNPNGQVTNQEAIAFLIRTLGLEKKAQENAAALATQYPDEPLLPLWSLGYLQEAMNLGIITDAEYQNALSVDQSTLPDDAFKRNDLATREDVAVWIARMLNTYDSDAYPIKQDLQKVYTYSDFTSIDPEKIIYVESVVANGIMANNTTTFNPKGSITRGEFASILKNLDSIYFTENNLEKKTGTVGGVKLNQTRPTAQYKSSDEYYIRNNEGKIDVIKKEYNGNVSPQAQTRDVVVYKNGTVGGLSLLKEGDQIEYIVETKPNKNPNELTCYYIQVTNTGLKTTTDFGKLESVDKDAQTITIRDYRTDQVRTYYSPASIFGNDINTGVPYMIMDQKKYDIDKLPYGSGVNLTLSNNVVASVQYVGEPTLQKEVRGIVVENNPDFGYMVIYNNNGTKTTYNYDTGSLQTVKKVEHYQNGDEIGYIDQVFSNGNYNPVNSTIDKIEAGDIVFIRPSASDPKYIESISAAPNYTTKSGTVSSIVDNGETINMLVTFSNGTQSLYTFPSDINIVKSGQLVDSSEIVVGDYIKFLVNTAIIQPGYVIETVKEIVVEDNNASDITKIVKGQISGITNIQREIQLQNAQTLEKDGWKNYKQVMTLSLKDTPEIFYNGRQIDLDYAANYLKRGNNEAYVALENSYSGENIKRITIYSGRDTILPSDQVVNSNNGLFTLGSDYRDVTTDKGTIVVKNGKLVSPNNIAVYDNAQVALNGGNNAAVVNITDEESVDGIQVARGRIQSVNDGVSFTVESIAELGNDKWTVSAVARTYLIDGNTVFIGDQGEITTIDSFLDYTADSVYGNVYNIISTDGTYADYVISAPYTKQPIKGTIYNVDEDNVYLKDVTYLDLNSNTWKTISNKDNTCVLKLMPNTAIIKQDAVVNSSNLKVGDKVEFFTPKIEDYKTVVPGVELEGYIVEVID